MGHVSHLDGQNDENKHRLFGNTDEFVIRCSDASAGRQPQCDCLPNFDAVFICFLREFSDGEAAC